MRLLLIRQRPSRFKPITAKLIVTVCSFLTELVRVLWARLQRFLLTKRRVIASDSGFHCRPQDSLTGDRPHRPTKI